MTEHAHDGELEELSRKLMRETGELMDFLERHDLEREVEEAMQTFCFDVHTGTAFVGGYELGRRHALQTKRRCPAHRGGQPP